MAISGEVWRTDAGRSATCDRVVVRAHPLPHALTGRPFRISDAREAGVSLGRLRAGDLEHSVWGVRRESTGTLALRGRCELVALRLSDDAFFTHATAALLWGAPLPFWLERRAAVDVATSPPSPPPHARGIRGHCLDLSSTDVVVVGGLRCTSAARTWCDLGAILSLEDLVAVGDYLIHRRMPFVSIAELRRVVATLTGRRGVKRLREALELLNDRAESRPESRLRVILVRAGFDQPTVNHVVVQTETGSTMRLDLAFEREKLVLEYQGDYHRTPSQWRKDMTRRARLEAEGWYVMEINSDDLRDPGELLERIASVLRRRPLLHS